MPNGAAAAQIALALAIGLLIGFEREWSNKDAGIRTCALTALLGMIASLVSAPFTLAGLAGVIVLIAFINARALRATQSLEITTSAALLLVYALGALVGRGDYFTPVAVAIVATLLLTWKLELHRFAGGLQINEIRSAVWLAVIAFVVYPLLPNRTLDPWHLVNLHTVWVAVVVVAAVGFANYVLLRLYSARGMLASAFLGGLVSSAATILELGSSLEALGEDARGMSVLITLVATLAMYARNLVLLAIFAAAALRSAVLPTLAMAVLACALLWRRRGSEAAPEKLKLGSPIAMRRVLEFGALFLIIQVATTLAERAWGHGGAYAVAVLGGFFNSASATAAVGEMAAHGSLSVTAAGVATVLASMASAVANAPLMNRALHQKKLGWTNELLTWSLVVVGAIALGAETWLHARL